jgi:hypothetical protein
MRSSITFDVFGGHQQASGLSNNELQLASGAEKLGRRSQLNSVFDAHESLPA